MGFMVKGTNHLLLMAESLKVNSAEKKKTTFVTENN